MIIIRLDYYYNLIMMEIKSTLFLIESTIVAAL